MTTTDEAAGLTARGLVVFPLPPGGRLPAGRWQAHCLATPDQVRQRWRDGDNIGVACRASNLVGLDLDQDDDTDGLAVLAALAARLGEPWPDTLTVATPSGGRHLYFRAPTGRIVPSTSGGRSGLGPGIDVRAPGRHSGGYLIGPGSIVNGVPYVIVRDEPIRPLPDWITDRLTRPLRAGRQRAGRDSKLSCPSRT
ncbi:bifunctional DNA primase/polymerase [Streptomyces sp. B-S-A8]|uniref:Bifunctional DNA primase/polymerase n=1 Tax=Streptomyces solicavernae TaxID=3043614 RepID=A0ABT6S201_9ACTN|nr:bifunctional DNA primase/polymerase [Streptomyces sp. B-S-A8]MDI3390023.1 bifunctional DNA primase/polymerase [Streptomyces sp. B-S-A8]